MSKVAITIPSRHAAMEPGFARLRAAGCELVLNEHGRTLTTDELLALLPGCIATIAGGERYTEEVFAAAPDLKVVARMGVGYDAVDVAAASRHGVVVAMGFGSNHEAVADMALAMIAALGNDLFAYHRQVIDQGWGRHFHPGLWRSTVGILGLGRIGRALARRCRGFEMRILACDPVADPAYAAAEGIALVGLEELFREADFLSVHAPHDAGSDKIVNAARLALMKPTAFVINTARGGLIDEPALYEALSSGRIAGAGARRLRGRAAAAGFAAAQPAQRRADAALRRRQHQRGRRDDRALRRQRAGAQGRPQPGRSVPAQSGGAALSPAPARS